MKQGKKERHKQIQDDDELLAHSPASEGQMDTDTTELSDVAPVTEKQLYSMLQDLCSTLQVDVKQIAAEMRKELTDLGGRTGHLENRTEELYEAHNKVVEKLRRLGRPVVQE
ncbi:Hypothetical predicted protein [Pelobates cultripes]|uniref:Uncharacterized protein n=1 Tax=Pelobates cultripes TaxID=61616 RepID=A0AAD1RS05_PELCU|nr:Hypothetical predicted protein [Pelobates cultripes]